MTVPPEYDEEERLRERSVAEGVLPAEHKDELEREIEEHDREDREVDYLDPEDNEAHAPGQVCERCGTIITASQDARRRPDGHWVHEVCPPDLSGLPQG